jgi:hypothetical protein
LDLLNLKNRLPLLPQQMIELLVEMPDLEVLTRAHALFAAAEDDEALPDCEDALHVDPYSIVAQMQRERIVIRKNSGNDFH